MQAQLHWLSLAIYGCVWSASRPGRFTPRERAPIMHWIGSWVGPTEGLPLWRGEEFLDPVGNRTVILRSSRSSHVTILTELSRIQILLTECSTGTTQKLPICSGEISPTRCNNCVFYSQWLYSTCFRWQSHPSSGVQCCIWPQVSWLT